MRQVKIKSLRIENFKGLRSFSVDFGDSLTRIVGSNGTGKTSLFDAYLWLLLGTDSSNRASFNVQPLGEDGRTIDHLITSVTGVFDFDGTVHELKRSLHQTWSRRRGTKDPVLTGSESEYFIDGVPYKAGEFSRETAGLFCKPEDFQLISSTRAFGRLDTKTRRQKLIQMAGQMPDIINPEDYPRLSKHLSAGKDVDGIKRQLKYELDGLKSKQAEIPIKITENERDLPSGIDFGSIREQIAGKQAEVEEIDATLQKTADGKAGAFAELQSLKDELSKTSAELSEIEFGLATRRTKKIDEVNERASKARQDISACESRISCIGRDISDLESRIARETERKTRLGQQWNEKNNELYPDNIETVCPHCHRPYDEGDMTALRNEAIRAFNAGKAGVLRQIAAEGQRVSEAIGKYGKALADKKSELSEEYGHLEAAKIASNEADAALGKIPSLDTLKATSTEWKTVSARRDSLLQRITKEAPSDTEDERKLKNRKEALKREISGLTFELAKEQNIAKVESRRKELEEENVSLAQKIAGIEAVLYEIQKYQKAYIELVESMVSSMFKLVTWKMYSKNVSNDGETEICECLVDGVPVSTNVNTAGSVNAGIDIINALSAWLGVSVPLWIDGKESVTELLESPAQLITLSVVENQPLKVL